MTQTKFAIIVLAFIFGSAICCSEHKLPAAEILGLRLGMTKVEARSLLTGIADFARDEGRNQEVWMLKDASRFNGVAVGFHDDKIRYVTAFVDKDRAKEHVTFASIGDLSNAKAQIMEPHYRYIWDLPVSDGKAASSVIAYGDNPEFLTIYTLVERQASGELSETQEEDD